MKYEYLKENPLRPVDWRWRWSNDVVAMPGTPPRRLLRDPYIQRAVRFLRRQLEAGGDALANLLLAEDMPECFWADVLHSEGLETSGGGLQEGAAVAPMNPLRSELEARVLARQDDAEIARKMCLTPETVTTYRKLYIDVENRLDSPGYILNVAIGPQVHRGIYESNYELSWKFFGYLGGPHVLERLLTGMIQPRNVPAADIAGFLRDATGDALAKKALFAARNAHVTDMNANEFIGNFIKLTEVNNAGRSDLATEEREKALQATLKALGARRLAQDLADNPGAAYHGDTVLPLAARMRLASGESDELADIAANFRYPTRQG